MFRTLMALGATMAFLSGPAMITASMADDTASAGEAVDMSAAALVIRQAVLSWSEAPRACGKADASSSRITVLYCDDAGAS